MLYEVITMFVDLFDSLGTLLAVCREAGMVDAAGEIPRRNNFV